MQHTIRITTLAILSFFAVHGTRRHKFTYGPYAKYQPIVHELYTTNNKLDNNMSITWKRKHWVPQERLANKPPIVGALHAARTSSRNGHDNAKSPYDTLLQNMNFTPQKPASYLPYKGDHQCITQRKLLPEPTIFSTIKQRTILGMKHWMYTLLKYIR